MFNKKPKHDCMWKEVGRTFNPGLARNGLKARGYTGNEVTKMLYGVTNIEQHCTICDKIRVVSVAGKA